MPKAKAASKKIPRRPHVELRCCFEPMKSGNFSLVLDRHWTNILIVGFLQVTTTCNAVPSTLFVDICHFPRGLNFFQARVMHRLIACVAVHVLFFEHQMLEHRTEDQGWKVA